MRETENVTDTRERAGDGREMWLDMLRVAATLAVVMLHTLTGAVNLADPVIIRENRGLLIVKDLVTWPVPVFLMISGYLFLNPEKKLSYRVMLGRYCRRIVLALFLFGVPFACMEQIAAEGGIRLEMVGKAFLMVFQGDGWSHMWYLYLILFLYLITPVLKKLLEIVPRPGVLAIMGGLVLLGSIFPFLNILRGKMLFPQLPAWSIYLFYYMWGYLTVTGKLRASGDGTRARLRQGAGCRKRRHGHRAGVFLLVGTGAVCAAMAASRVIGSYQVQMPYNYPPTVLLSVLLMGLAEVNREWCSRAAGRKWKAVSSMSFTIYLIHPLFLNFFYKFLHVLPQDYPMALSLPAFFAAAAGLSLLGAWCLGRIPVLRKYVL